MDSVAVNKLLTAGHEVIERHYTKDELLSGALSDFDAVIVRSSTKLTSEVISKCEISIDAQIRAIKEYLDESKEGKGSPYLKI